MTPRSGTGSESRALIRGTAEGAVLVLDEPLSFWGGVDPATGEIVDVRHPQAGASVTGRILVMPSGRGSSSSSSVLAEALRLRTGPVAILLAEPDAIIPLGALVASMLYDVVCPVAVLDPATYASLTTGAEVWVEATFDVRVVPKPSEHLGG